MSSNLIINEEEMKDYVVTIKKEASRMESSVNEYLTILNDIRNNAIKEGEVAEALSSFISHSKLLKSQFIAIAQENQKIVMRFLMKVDKDDSFIY